MSKHTPIESWEFSKCTMGYRRISESTRLILDEIDFCYPMDDAYWRLIAAAPEMLEALKMSLDVMTKHSIEEVKAKIHAAIAKATGETE